MNSTMDKVAMTPEEKFKYIKAALIAAGAGAGIGALIRSHRAKKARRKALDAESSKNTIVVPIKKTKFMEGLPTPEELAASRGESVKSETAPQLPAPENTPALPAPEAKGDDMPKELTAEEIAAKKKEILRNNERRFDFFGKRAASKRAKEESEKETADENEEKPEKKKEDSSDASKEERMLFRDQEGKFVSPTDPIAVKQQEKTAVDGFSDLLFHPIDSMKRVWDSATDKPIWLTAGALGSIYVAAKISDAINERRREKAKQRLENARSEYVELLEGSDKEASDIRDISGATVGGAFFIPLALTALVTNRIIENRKLEKKRQKEMSDSYPDEPIIMYKTSEAKEIPMSPESLLAMIMVKSAVMENIERDLLFVKDAGIKEWFGGNSATEASATDDAVKYLNDPQNKQKMLNLVRAYSTGSAEDRRKAMEDITSGMGSLGNWWKGNTSYWQNPAFQSKIMSDPRIYDNLAYQFNNDDDYMKYRDEMIDRRISKWGFKNGGVLHAIISWFMKTFGIGANGFNKELKDRLNSFSGKNQDVQSSSGTNSQQQAKSQNVSPESFLIPDVPQSRIKPMSGVRDIKPTPIAPTIQSPLASLNNESAYPKMPDLSLPAAPAPTVPQVQTPWDLDKVIKDYDTSEIVRKGQPSVTAYRTSDGRPDWAAWGNANDKYENALKYQREHKNDVLVR